MTDHVDLVTGALGAWCRESNSQWKSQKPLNTSMFNYISGSQADHCGSYLWFMVQEQNTYQEHVTDYRN